jgi:predicted amidophosphoribosyltransferase
MSGRTLSLPEPGTGQWLAGRLLDVLYPARCVNCGRFGATFCEPCEELLAPATGNGRCPNCSAHWDLSGNRPRCFGWFSLDGVRASFEMDGPARKVVHGLKYRGVQSLAVRMAEAMEPLRAATPFDVALPVPLHRARERQRGFNQSELILDRLGWERPEGSLRRTRNPQHQIGKRRRLRQGELGPAEP